METGAVAHNPLPHTCRISTCGISIIVIEKINNKKIKVGYPVIESKHEVAIGKADRLEMIPATLRGPHAAWHHLSKEVRIHAAKALSPRSATVARNR